VSVSVSVSVVDPSHMSPMRVLQGERPQQLVSGKQLVART
jgi:hypothetical protein